jgi:hypothetical protein
MNYPLTITLSSLSKKRACFNGYNKVVRSLQGLPFTSLDSTREYYISYEHRGPLPLASIVSSNCLGDALWALLCIPGTERDSRLFAVWCARRVQHLMTDPRSIAAPDVAERYANGEATDSELAAAWTAANAAAWTTEGTAAFAAAFAARAAKAAAGAAAFAARAATGASEEDAQKSMFIKMCEGRAPWQTEEKI